MVLETRMSGLVPTIVCLLLLASQLRGQEQSVIYPDPSTKRQTETLSFCCVSAQTASHNCHQAKV